MTTDEMDVQPITGGEQEEFDISEDGVALLNKLVVHSNIFDDLLFLPLPAAIATFGYAHWILPAYTRPSNASLIILFCAMLLVAYLLSIIVSYFVEIIGRKVFPNYHLNDASIIQCIENSEVMMTLLNMDCGYRLLRRLHGQRSLVNAIALSSIVSIALAFWCAILFDWRSVASSGSLAIIAIATCGLAYNQMLIIAHRFSELLLSTFKGIETQ